EQGDGRDSRARGRLDDLVDPGARGGRLPAGREGRAGRGERGGGGARCGYENSAGMAPCTLHLPSLPLRLVIVVCPSGPPSSRPKDPDQLTNRSVSIPVRARPNVSHITDPFTRVALCLPSRGLRAQ